MCIALGNVNIHWPTGWEYRIPLPMKEYRSKVGAFLEASTILDRRSTLLLCLPLATLEQEVIQSEIDRIGRH